MDRQIGVQIEGDRYIRLVNIDREKQGELKFTTIQDGQRRALVKVFLFENERMLPLKEIEVGGIPHEKAGVPEIDLSTEFDGKKTLTLVVKLNGRGLSREVVEIRRQSEGINRRLVLIPVLLVIFVSLFFVVKRSSLFQAGSGPRDIDKKLFIEVSERQKQPFEKETAIIKTPEKITTPIENETIVKESAPIEKEKTSSSSSLDKRLRDEEPVGSGKNENRDEINIKEHDSEKEQSSARSEVDKVITSGNPLKTVYFAPGRAMLTLETSEKLDEILKILKRNRDKKVIITGHCALYSTEEGRHQLSVMRANNVYWYLRDRGWNPGTKPEVSGMGGLQFITMAPDSQHLNRRVEISIIE
jgi:outer membrane protein OmpA-like peptidoglycan-associated protein